MTELVETAALLIREHPRRTITEDGPVYGTEPALLDILRDSVAAYGGLGAGGVSSSGVPVNVDAVDLLTEVTRIIDTCWPGNSDPAYVRVPLAIKLNAWVTHTTDPVAQGVLLDLCRQWVSRIRELLEPTKRVPIPGVACLTCGHSETAEEVDGETVRRPILVAYPDAVPVTVVCTSEECDGQWSGLSELGRFRVESLTLESAVMVS